MNETKNNVTSTSDIKQLRNCSAINFSHYLNLQNVLLLCIVEKAFWFTGGCVLKLCCEDCRYGLNVCWLYGCCGVVGGGGYP